MIDHLDPATIARYLAGDLDVGEARAVEAHLATCPRCEESFLGAIEAATAPSQAVSPVLWRAERFGRQEPAQSEAEASATAESPEDRERREAVGDFLGDLGRTLAVRGEREVNRLLALSEFERRRAIRAESERPAEMTEDVAARLLARCRRGWTGDLHDLHDLPEAIEAAKLAVLVTQGLTPTAPTAGIEAYLDDLRSLALQHLAASNRIARRAGEIHAGIELRRPSAPLPDAPATESDAYPQGIPGPLWEVAEDALSVEIEAALDDLRDASLARGRARDAALAMLDRARLALARGGPLALAALSRAEAGRWTTPEAPPVPRDALRYLAAEAQRGTADRALIDRLVRVVLDAAGGFGEPFAT